MKALFLINPNAGKARHNRKIKYIKKHLAPFYDVFDVVNSISPKHFISVILNDSINYDLLLIGGGDGSVNLAINALMKLNKKPILGFVPMGTLNDFAKNLDYPTSIKKVVLLIKSSVIRDIDIMRINNRYALYVACAGAYSDIPYVTKNITKKLFRKFAYYFKAIPRLFKSQVLEGFINTGGSHIPFRSNFILIMNGRRIGGFNVNKSSRLDDGEVEILYTPPSLFNSLPTYFFKRKNINILKLDKCEIEISNRFYWDIDGEKAYQGKVKIEVKKHALTILTN